MIRFSEEIGRVVGPSLDAAGFGGSPGWWIRTSPSGTVAVTAFSDRATHVAVLGWSYPALGDPAPEPLDARGCARTMPLDLAAPAADLKTLMRMPAPEDQPAYAQWVQRLRVAWNRAVVPWLDTWRRPEGFRDYLTSRSFHLASAWVSAELGHDERALAELAAAHRSAPPALAEMVNRREIEFDLAVAAPFAARHGLAEYLDAAARTGRSEVLQAFVSPRGRAAQAQITTPEAEHERMVHRAAVFADLCHRVLRSRRPTQVS